MSLNYYRARWYDPQAKRFITEDPIGLDGGINLYAYTGNNPINKIDPTGLFFKELKNWLLGIGQRLTNCFFGKGLKRDKDLVDIRVKVTVEQDQPKIKEQPEHEGFVITSANMVVSEAFHVPTDLVSENGARASNEIRNHFLTYGQREYIEYGEALQEWGPTNPAYYYDDVITKDGKSYEQRKREKKGN
jgi:uncharacterized protein RhaS with RHS repeats